VILSDLLNRRRHPELYDVFGFAIVGSMKGFEIIAEV
jgi:hypothetical protein